MFDRRWCLLVSLLMYIPNLFYDDKVQHEKFVLRNISILCMSWREVHAFIHYLIAKIHIHIQLQCGMWAEAGVEFTRIELAWYQHMVLSDVWTEIWCHTVCDWKHLFLVNSPQCLHWFQNGNFFDACMFLYLNCFYYRSKLFVTDAKTRARRFPGYC